MNIETVQRWVASVILIHVGSVPAVTLAVRSVLSLWLVAGILPTAITGFYVL